MIWSEASWRVTCSATPWPDAHFPYCTLPRNHDGDWHMDEDFGFRWPATDEAQWPVARSGS